jgi:serine/threonine-protein kinase RsbT
MRETIINGGACVQIDGDRAIVSARQQGLALALGLGFSAGGATLVATAISELARNILLYAGEGEIVLKPVERTGNEGLVIVARDRGPGIQDIPRAMEDGYSTSGRLGLGLPGVKRLMDEFEVVSATGNGTQIRAVKWRRP